MKSWMLLPHVALVVVMITFSACSEEEAAPVAPTVVKSIVPLRVGLTWTYRDTRFEPDGTEISVEYGEVKIWSSATQDNEPWYCYGLRGSGIYYANRLDGLYERSHSTYLGGDWWTRPKLKLKYPVQEGETFTDGDNNAVRVASVSQHVSVRAGSYDCIVYVRTEPGVDSSNASWRDVMYYCPGVGRVLSELYSRTFEGTMYLNIHSELTQAPGI